MRTFDLPAWVQISEAKNRLSLLSSSAWRKFTMWQRLCTGRTRLRPQPLPSPPPSPHIHTSKRMTLHMHQWQAITNERCPTPWVEIMIWESKGERKDVDSCCCCCCSLLDLYDWHYKAVMEYSLSMLQAVLCVVDTNERLSGERELEKRVPS